MCDLDRFSVTFADLEKHFKEKMRNLRCGQQMAVMNYSDTNEDYYRKDEYCSR